MGVGLEEFATGEIYIEDPYEETRYRFDKESGTIYGRFFAKPEHEIPHTNSYFRDALSSGKKITKEEYYRD